MTCYALEGSHIKAGDFLHGIDRKAKGIILDTKQQVRVVNAYMRRVVHG
jgi:hypothetical protein